MPPVLQAAVEGDLDEAVLRRLVRHCGAELGNVYGREGKSQLKASIGGYNAAAKRFPWVVLVDLDESHECAGELRTEWLPDEAPLMCLRVAVRQVESWLLADKDSAAPFLGVSQATLPADPDAELHSKRRLVHLAERSRWRPIREGLVPPPGSGRAVGPLYNALLRRFVVDRWKPDVAATRSESLRRCLLALEELVTVADS